MSRFRSACMLLSFLLPAPALAAESGAPDFYVYLRVSEEASRAALLRARGTFGTVEMNRPKVTKEGLRLVGSRSAWSGGSSAQERTIHWNEVTQIEAVHTRTGRGAAIGFLTGLVAGIVWTKVHPPQDKPGLLEIFKPTKEATAVGRVLACTAAGTLLGAAVGSGFETSEVIYP